VTDVASEKPDDNDLEIVEMPGTPPEMIDNQLGTSFIIILMTTGSLSKVLQR